MERVGSPLSNKNRGSATFSYPEPWLFLSKVIGHFASDKIDDYLADMSKVFQRGRPAVGFHDWSEMSNYDSNTRKQLTEWALEQRGKLPTHHILVQSKLVAMGVSTASLLLGGNAIMSYTDRAVFERALHKVRGG
jgi:hypothetical protein